MKNGWHNKKQTSRHANLFNKVLTEWNKPSKALVVLS